MRKLTVALVLALAALAFSTGSAANMPDPYEGLYIDFVVSEDLICPKPGQPISLEVVVGSNLELPVEVTEIRTSRIVRGQIQSAFNGQDVPTVGTAEGLLSFEAAVAGTTLVDDTDFLVSPAVLQLPEEEGYHAEIVAVYWRCPDSDSVIDVQRTLFYLVEDECMEVVDQKEYEYQTASYEEVALHRGDIATTVLDQMGYTSSETAESEVFDLAIRMDEPETLPVDDLEIASDLESKTGDDSVTDSRAVLDLTFCVKVQYRDNFVNPPTNTTGMKWWRPYGDLSYVNLQGLIVELWDYNSSGGDFFIGEYALYYSGLTSTACMQFQWDQAAHPNDLYPDPYVRTVYKVMDTEFTDPNKRTGHLCTDGCACGSRPPYSWRNNYFANFGPDTIYFPPQLNFGGYSSEANAQAMQMASLQKFFRTWHSQYMTGDINVYWRYEYHPSSSSGTCINLSYRYWSDIWQQYIYSYRRWDVASHEAGHSYQTQLMGTTFGSYPSGGHAGWCSYYPYSAMKEGWAEFVATRTWYPDSKSTSQPIYATFILTHDVEPGGYLFPAGYGPASSSCGEFQCTLPISCDCYSRNEIMALRAFWDIWDTHVDGVDDANTEVSWQNMALIWDLYPSGSGNACRSEPNTNMQDYRWNSLQISADAFWDVGRVYSEGQTDMVCQPWP